MASQHPADRIGPYLVELLPEARSAAEETLALYGGAAVPLLLPLLRQHTGQAQMAYIGALAAIGEPSIPALRQELTGPSVAGRVGAARTLGLLARQAQDAFDDLVAVLKDGDAEVRYSAAQALVWIDVSRAGAAVPHLVAGLESADVKIRSEAATMLALLAQAGRPAEVALPALSKLLTDPEVRLEAARAVVAIDPGQAVAAVPVLVEALERSKPVEIPAYDSSGAVAAEAILVALGRIGQPAAVAVPLIAPGPASPECGHLRQCGVGPGACGSGGRGRTDSAPSPAVRECVRPGQRGS